jgi:sterol desaturase/sphingolipid hydroxylase (fatty acid hydroxylase superfamily)
VGTLSRLHLQHHAPRLMMRHNFNSTYPVGDWLFGTLCRPQREAGR